MSFSSGSAGGLKQDINVTPLVDVCLVLLIIFMVVVLPQPEGPTSTHSSPRSTSSERASTATAVP